MKNILLVGERYSTNLGDGVIYQTVERMIQADIPDITIYGLDLSGRVAYSDDTDWLLSCNDVLIAKYISPDIARARLVKKQLQLLLKRHHIDVIVFVGGQLFMDYFLRPIAVIMKEAEQRKIPVIYSACGFGRNSLRGQKRIEKMIHSDVVTAVSLRDTASIHNLSCRSAVMVTDPVVELATYWPELRRRQKKAIQRVGINIMSPWTTHRENPEKGNAYMKRLLVKTIDFCEKQGLQWHIYSNGASEDGAYIYGICRELGVDHDKVSLPQTPEQLVKLIASYDMIVGFRMHTHIIAHALNIPTVGIVWDNKIAHYAKQVGQAEQFLAIDAPIDQVCQKIEQTINQSLVAIRKRGDRKLSSQFLSETLTKLFQ